MNHDTPGGASPSRRTILRAGLGVAASLSLGSPAVHAAERTVRLSYQRSSTLLTILKAKGTLDERLKPLGFAPSWHLFTSVIEPMNAGAVDLHADVADAIPIFTQAANAQLTFYAREIGVPSAEAIIVPAESPIRSIADLKGRTVGVSRGSGCHFILAAALKKAGLGFPDIKPAYLQAPEGLVAFNQGSLDAWVIWDPFLAIAQSKRPVRVLADATGLSSYHRYFLANDRFVAENPQVVATVYEALKEAGRWAKAEPDAAVALLAPIWGDLSPDIVATVNRRRTYEVTPVTRAELGEQQEIADTFYEAKLIPRKLDATGGSDLAAARRAGGVTRMSDVPRFGIWAAVHGSRASHHDPDEPDDASWTRNRALVLEAEALGFDSVLVAQHTVNPYDDERDQLEAWTASAALAALTRRIEIIAAIKPGLYHPVVLAKMALQIEHVSEGRFALNLVNAWNKAEFERAGLPFPAHDDRYAYGREWIGLVDRLMRGERVTHAGRHFHVEDYQLRPVGTFRPRPTVYLGGESEPARALAAERADVWFINGQPLDDVRALIADVARRPAANGPLRYGLSAFVIARETDAEAEAEHARLLALARRDEGLRNATRARTDAASVMFAKTDAAATRHVGTNGGTAAGLVGSYETVAARIRAFHGAGIDLFMLQFQPFEAEMRRFAKEILPRVR